MNMSRFPLLAVVLGVFATGCGSDPAPTPAAPPNRLVFTATISALNEVPPITNAESGARGEATLTFNVTRDGSGNITTGSVDVLATFTGFPQGSSLTAAHIHTGISTVSGGVVVPLIPSPGEVTFPNGNGSYVRTGFPIGDIANQIVANPAAFYFNVHSALNPGGVARGQLALKP
jgi:CHRD domain